jgi:hypothetical protein
MNSAEFVLGQRYTMAAVALTLALLSFLNLAGLEKAIVAIAFGLRALKPSPGPALEARRSWAKLAIGLGVCHATLLVTIVLWNLDRLPKLVEALRAVADAR